MKRVLFFSFSLTYLLLSLAFPVSVRAQFTMPWSGACVSEQGVATITGIECIITNILSIAITAIGIAAFVMLLVGALTYMMSGGVPKDVETAKKTISFAVLGIIVAISAFILLNFVSVFTGVGEKLFILNLEPSAGP